MLIIHCLKKRNLILVLVLVFIHIGSVYSQHRGDNLSFQGTYSDNLLGVKALAMGGAYTAQTGDVSSLFYNPAGLSDLPKIQFNVAGNYNTELWREHQEWRPDRLFVTLPFYLSGLAPLDPKYDGQLDTARFRDPNYIVKPPKLGLDPYSKEAADWQKTMNKFAISYIAAAIPFTLFDNKFGAAASYNRQNISDYDRNDTYLDPFIGYFGYGAIPQVNGTDTLVFSWSRFYRQRVGYLNNIPLGIGGEVIENLKFGVGVNISWGKTTDYQESVAYFCGQWQVSQVSRAGRKLWTGAGIGRGYVFRVTAMSWLAPDSLLCTNHDAPGPIWHFTHSTRECGES